jgi:hypothetical protein
MHGTFEKWVSARAGLHCRPYQESGKAHPLFGIDQACLTACFWTGLVSCHSYARFSGVKGYANTRSDSSSTTRTSPITLTNLLSLNAAIEAAQAGEAGRASRSLRRKSSDWLVRPEKPRKTRGPAWRRKCNEDSASNSRWDYARFCRRPENPSVHSTDSWTSG